MTNIWKRGPVTTNPYYETAFQALGISRDVTSRAEIRQRVEERKEAVRHNPGYYRFGGRALTEADVREAGQVLSDPTRRILEELLEHKPEKLQVDEIERLQARLTMPDWPEELPPPRHLAFLLRAAQELAAEYLAHLPPADVPPFPVDLTTIPPFGLPDEAEED